MNSLYVLDLGKNNATLANRGINKEMSPDELKSAEEEVTILTHKEVLDLPAKLSSGSIIAVEDAHLGRPRTELSLSQPFEELDLMKFYDLCKKRNITLRLFPQKLTPRALEFSHPNGQKSKSDTLDPMAIHSLLTHFPQLVTKRPVSSFEEDPRKIEGWEYKQKTNDILNIERRVGYEGTPMRSVLDKIVPKIILEISSKESLEVFGFTNENKYKTGAKKGEYKPSRIKIGAMFSILAMLVDRNGNLRKRSQTHCPPGLNFAKEFLFGMTPFHDKGGVARSNLMHHLGRCYIRGKWKEENPNDLAFTKKSNRGSFTLEEDAHFLKYRSKLRRALLDMFQAMKQILERE
jgi:hypothetical protein